MTNTEIDTETGKILAAQAWELGRTLVASFQANTGQLAGLVLPEWENLNPIQQTAFALNIITETNEIATAVATLCGMISEGVA